MRKLKFMISLLMKETFPPQISVDEISNGYLIRGTYYKTKEEVIEKVTSIITKELNK